MINKLLPLVVVIGVAIWSVGALVKCGNCVADYGKDGELITWIINTAGKNIYGLHSDATGTIFHGNIFYPYRNILAYSDMYFVSAVWSHPVALIAHNPMIINTLVLAVGQVLTMLVMFFWWKNISGNDWAAVIGTTAFGLSQIRMEYQVHVQMWGLQYMLIATWLIVKWLEDKKDWKLFLGAGILGLQVWESLLPVYFAGVIIIAKLTSLFFLPHPISLSLIKEREKKGEVIKKIILAVLLFGIIAAPPLLAYWGVGGEFGFRRDIREAAHNGMSVEQIFTKFGSPGLYLLFAVAISRIFFRTPPNPLLNSRGGTKGGVHMEIKWLLMVVFISLILALGPVLKWRGETVRLGGRDPVPLPYAAAYYLVPGFDALRTPSRWMWVAGWATSGIITLGISNYQFPIFNQFTNTKFSKYKTKKLLGYLGLILVAVIGGSKITKVRKLPDYRSMPEVYKQLEKMPGKVVLEVPMGNENSETGRMIYSLYHGKTLVNGFSGFTPPGYWEMAKWVNNGLTVEENAKLKIMSVDYVIDNGGKLIEL